jgi:heterotetrameric sarcosine oxidase delta subunit
VLLIPCPWCGPRGEVEFVYGGQAGIAYPADPEALSDDEWADFLFMRDNPRGDFTERWVHAAGCRRWFTAVRDTSTHRFVKTYAIGEGPPEADRTAGNRPSTGP